MVVSWLKESVGPLEMGICYIVAIPLLHCVLISLQNSISVLWTQAVLSDPTPLRHYI